MELLKVKKNYFAGKSVPGSGAEWRGNGRCDHRTEKKRRYLSRWLITGVVREKEEHRCR